MRNHSIALIGAGRVGSALARGLKAAGFNLRYIASKPPADAEALTRETGAKVIAPPYRELENADLIFLAVPDGEIADAAAELAEAPLDWKGKTVLHTSGALTSEALKPLRKKGALCGSFHPLQTFPPGCGGERFKGIHFAVEGEGFELGSEIARALGGKPFRLSAEAKAHYHAAAVVSANFIFALAAAAREILADGGLDRNDWRMLLPLMQGTLDSLLEYGIEESLTGPVSRGDAETIAGHLEILRDRLELLELYRALGGTLLKIARLSDEQREKIGRVLEGG